MREGEVVLIDNLQKFIAGLAALPFVIVAWTSVKVRGQELHIIRGPKYTAEFGWVTLTKLQDIYGIDIGPPSPPDIPPALNLKDWITVAEYTNKNKAELLYHYITKYSYENKYGWRDPETAVELYQKIKEYEGLRIPPEAWAVIR